MNIYDIWINSDKKCCLISEMDTSYINACVGQIHKAADIWRYDSYDDLSQSDKRNIHTPLQRAWYVVNAYDYLRRFRKELRNRCEDIDYVDEVIEYIELSQHDSKI